MLREMARILWSAVGKRLVIVPVTATGLAIWLAPIVSPDDTISVRWLYYLAPITIWLISVPLVTAAKLQLQANLIPEPDYSLRKAFQHVMLHAKVAIGTNPDDENFYTDIEIRLRDSARQGRLMVWARPISNWPGGFRETWLPIKIEQWDQVKIDLPSCVFDSKSSAELRDDGQSSTQYLEDAQVSRHQVHSEWPKASWWARYRDPQFKRRLEYFEQERRGPATGPPSCEE